MTDLVPADSIEQIVGRRRHPTDHIARRIGQTVYILHSVECRESGHDLRACDYSRALDMGCGVVSWEPYGDTPVRAGISRGGLLIPTGWAEP